MTRAELESAKTLVPGLFASGHESFFNKVDSKDSGFSYKSGIPSSYSSYNGKRVNRLDVNGLVRATTQSKFFNQLGGYYTFSQEVSDMIGGYPFGAVLKYKDESSGHVREVRSLIQDNTYDFVTNPEYINNIYWSFVDNIPQIDFRPRIFPDFSRAKKGQVQLGWKIPIDIPCLFIIQTGCSTTDRSPDGSDYYLYATVKKNGHDIYSTAGLICYLPADASCFSQGMVSLPLYSFAAEIVSKSFYAWNAPFPLQIYLSQGDVVSLQGNRECSALQQETFQYWIVPLDF